MNQEEEMQMENSHFSESTILDAKKKAKTSKKLRKAAKEEKSKHGRKKHWKSAENMRYVEFLRTNEELFTKGREDKRLMRINILMSKFVKTKTSTQCRSHHQKMVKHYGTIAKTIVALTNLLCDTPSISSNNHLQPANEQLNSEPTQNSLPSRETQIWDLVAGEWWCE